MFQKPYVYETRNQLKELEVQTNGSRKNEERNDEKMRMDIERNTDSEKRLMGYITAIAESRDQ